MYGHIISNYKLNWIHIILPNSDTSEIHIYVVHCVNDVLNCVVHEFKLMGAAISSLDKK